MISKLHNFKQTQKRTNILKKKRKFHKHPVKKIGKNKELIDWTATITLDFPTP